MIAYMIQCHDNFSQIVKLLSWLYHKDDIFIISIDANSKIDGIDCALEMENVFLAPRHPITWGGMSIVQATFSSIRMALDYSGWEYFINLGALDIPLINRVDLIKELKKYAAENVFNFISDFGPIEFTPQIWRGPSNSAYVKSTYITISAPGGAVIELRGQTSILQIPGDKGHGGFLPVVTPSLRTAFNVSEGAGGKCLSCRPLYVFESEARSDFLKAYPYRFGRQWVVLHREICEAALFSATAHAIYAFLGETFIPDEAFFQTFFNALNGRGTKAGLERNNRRYNFGAPERIHDGNFGAVRSSGAWFARKLDIPNSHKAIAETDSLMKSNF